MFGYSFGQYGARVSLSVYVLYMSNMFGGRSAYAFAHPTCSVSGRAGSRSEQHFLRYVSSQHVYIIPIRGTLFGLVFRVFCVLFCSSYGSIWSFACAVC